jgi:hypothetical protein
LNFTLQGIQAGTAPLQSIAWEVFVNGNPTPDPNFSGNATNVPVGGTLFSQNAPLTAGIYVVNVTSLVDGNGCSIPPAVLAQYYSATIMIKPAPTLSGVSATPITCSGGTTTFTVSGLLPNVSTTFSYTVNPGNQTGTQNSMSDGSGNISFTQTNLPVGTYTFALNSISVNGCTTTFSSNNSASFTIHPLPQAQISLNNVVLPPVINATTELCITDNIILTLSGIQSGVAPFTFNYTLNGNTQTSGPVALNGDIFSQLTPLTPGTYVILMTSIIDGNGCQVSPAILPYYNHTFIIRPRPAISNQVTGANINVSMVSGGNYTHAQCHDTPITTSVPTFTTMPQATACGVLRIKTEYISTLPNIPSATVDVTYAQALMAGPQTISPNNTTGMTQTITFITTPYYDVNGNNMLDAGDVDGQVTNFVLTVHPIPSGAITGSGFVVQNSPTTLNVTFTGSVGTAPYTFTYTINGGTTQTISTLSTNNAITLPHPNGTPGVFTYTLLSVTDAYGCAGLVGHLQDTVVITVIDANMIPDLAPSIARPLNSSFISGQMKEGYVQFINGGTGPTFGMTKVRLPKTVSNFNLVINQTATMAAGQNVQNNMCTFADLGTVWEITYPVAIPVGTNIKIGYTLTASGITGSNGTMTATILNGTGGDNNNANNRATRRFVIN